MRFNKFIFLIFIAFINKTIFANNSILVVVDKNLITLNQFNQFSKGSISKEEKRKIIDKLIIELLEKDYISRFNIKPSEDSIKKELIKLSQQNNIQVEQLQKASNFDEIFKLIIYKLSKNALFEIVIKTEKAKRNNIDLRTNEEIYNSWLKEIKDKTYIEVYEEKL